VQVEVLNIFPSFATSAGQVTDARFGVIDV
jgi:hypothetical protein